MPLYASKSAFLASDMKACPMPPSDPSCPICREDLQPHEPEASSTGPTADDVQGGTLTPNSSAADHDTIAANSAPVEPNEDHSPVKVTCCNNIFGRDCLESWLTRANSCPFCRAEFFPSQTVPTEMTFEWFAQLIERAEARTDARLEAARARYTEGMTAATARFTEGMVARYIQRMEAAASGITGIRRRDLRTLEALQQAGPDVGLPTRDDAEDESELSSEYESEDESDSMPELEPLDEMEGYHSESGSVLSEDEDDESEFEDDDEDSGDEDEGGDGPPEGPGSGGAVCIGCAHTGASVRA
ncbi:uncharacterized protein J4E78_007376 [Alternaria triticimaculans]|uniref:uncharacterized protein n=1 Tax=Alternaria triticimaculans TaxID=297637 RepID=UPI0020C250F3|nr:uncharacterized protein J4E78_007376 [Alternaria triticimaculans]KAI4654331.1 hypothetical protein J4E78_007376 [Alternaria triticimaculans]